MRSFVRPAGPCANLPQTASAQSSSRPGIHVKIPLAYLQQRVKNPNYNGFGGVNKCSSGGASTLLPPNPLKPGKIICRCSGQEFSFTAKRSHMTIGRIRPFSDGGRRRPFSRSRLHVEESGVPAGFWKVAWRLHSGKVTSAKTFLTMEKEANV